MANFSRRGQTYSALTNEVSPPLAPLMERSAMATAAAAPTLVAVDHDHEDTTNVIIHKVPNTKEGWTHIEDLDSFFTRMYRYYLSGGFYPMLMADTCHLIQLVFVMWFSTFLVHCVNYPRLFRDDPAANRTEKLTLSDVIYDANTCIERISWKWWCVASMCAVVWLLRLFISIYHLYYAYDTKLFYNHALKINDSDLAWVNWSTIQERVREAQLEHHMCVHKREINELDIYHRILRFNNYMVAMVNKNLLPLQIHVPILGDFHYLSKGLKYNLEFLLFSSPWSPWENCWQLRECYKEHSKRMLLARQLEKQILILALVNLLLAPLIQAWQILYFFFNYAELIKRSPGSLGLRTWSVFARITLRHFNELDHELRDRLTRAHKPAAKYLASFTSPTATVLAKNVAFVSASILGVLVVLSVYDEDVLTVEHVLTVITIFGCILAAARALIGETEGGCTGPARGEELFIQVLGHVHYLPAAWRARAHTRTVAMHFQQLFQFRAAYIMFELVSPVLCPLVLLSLRSRALDIVDFYRNFTVSVLGIGDVCSFAQLDIRRHGHPDWQKPNKFGKESNPQYNQGEGGKTELSLVAFSCRHPTWSPAEPAQRQFLRSLRQSMHNALPHHSPLNKTMLGSFIQQSIFGSNTPLPAVLSYYQQRAPYRLPGMDETSDEEEGSPSEAGAGVVASVGAGVATLAGVGSVLGASALGLREPDPDQAPPDYERDMSVSTLHLYDLHLSQLDIRRHGHPDWQKPNKFGKESNPQYNQGEGGKTELSLVAFSCRHPTWSPAEPAQRQFLRSLRQSMHNALPHHSPLNKTMLGSFIQQSIFGSNTPLPAVLSYYQQRAPYRLPGMDETSDEEEGSPSEAGAGVVASVGAGVATLAGVGSVLGASALGLREPDPDQAPPDYERDMSVSTLHLYDLHLSQAGQSSSACCAAMCSERDDRSDRGGSPRDRDRWPSGEQTPLLHRP